MVGQWDSIDGELCCDRVGYIALTVRSQTSESVMTDENVIDGNVINGSMTDGSMTDGRMTDDNEWELSGGRSRSDAPSIGGWAVVQCWFTELAGRIDTLSMDQH